jgi:lipopolysaccharide export system protein LptC
MSDTARQVRSQRQRWAAPGSGHDRFVAVARIALPVAVVAIALALVFAPLGVRQEMSFVLDKKKVEVAKERMRVETATYRGEDDRGRPFVVAAGSAVQKSSTEPVVHINQLSAKLQLSDGPAQVHADRADYHLDNDQVAVAGPIRFQAADGYQLDTSNTVVDLKNRTMASTGGVSGSVPQGIFSANHLHADLDAHSVRLDGNARLRIMPRRAR